MKQPKHIPLHKRAHYRRTREVITEIAKHEKVQIRNYDLFNMRVFDTFGESLIGHNVSYNTPNDQSCFVEDNQYDVFEVPHKDNKNMWPYGKFLVLIFNSSFDYYFFGEMTVNLDREESIRNRFPEEHYHYKMYGRYTIVFETNKNFVTKTHHIKDWTVGYNSNEMNYVADGWSVRKKSYKLNNHEILKRIGLQTTQQRKVVDKKPVDVYKKNKNNKNKKKRY